MLDALLLTELRGGVMESAHRGHISIVNEKGEVVYFAGDPILRPLPVLRPNHSRPYRALGRAYKRNMDSPLRKLP